MEREKLQSDLISSQAVFKASVEAKLRGIAAGSQMDNFLRCGVEEIFCTCTGCGRAEKFFYNCNRKWCPLCSQRLSLRRAQVIKAWATRITQPKHLVLTMRNFPIFTRKKLREFTTALRHFRKHNSWSQVKGGCCSVEITNEGNGWHLHAHLLLDVKWLDMSAISVEWGKLVGQQFGIVKIKDVRKTNYVQEVSKYCVKGSELAGWPGEHIWEFICAIKGSRLFFPFGTLRKQMKEIRRELRAAAGEGKVCKCGCAKFLYQTEADVILDEIRAATGGRRRGRR
ncbi:MAG: protein rep [Candidatus Acidiferrum sp.]